MNWQSSCLYLEELTRLLYERLNVIHETVPAKGRGEFIAKDKRMNEIRKLIVLVHELRIDIQQQKSKYDALDLKASRRLSGLARSQDQ